MVSQAIVCWPSGSCAQLRIVAPSRGMIGLAVAVAVAMEGHGST